MLYEEFLKGTGATMGPSSLEQYNAINKIYSDCDCMSKQDAYKLWKSTYGRNAKAKDAAARDWVTRIALMYTGEEPEGFEVKAGENALKAVEKYISNGETDKAPYVDEYGVSWRCCEYENGDLHPWLAIWLDYKGWMVLTNMDYHEGTIYVMARYGKKRPGRDARRPMPLAA